MAIQFDDRAHISPVSSDPMSQMFARLGQLPTTPPTWIGADQPNPTREPSPDPSSPATLTVYVSIGNSDDKLSQLEWYEFQQDTLSDIKEACSRIFGVWYSEAVSPYQNMCVGFEISDVALRDDSHWYHDNVAKLRDDLALLCEHFKQESIAWAVVAKTEFIKPVMR